MTRKNKWGLFSNILATVALLSLFAGVFLGEDTPAALKVITTILCMLACIGYFRAAIIDFDPKEKFALLSFVAFLVISIVQIVDFILA